jgi:hypothetical protein
MAGFVFAINLLLHICAALHICISRFTKKEGALVMEVLLA